MPNFMKIGLQTQEMGAHFSLRLLQITYFFAPTLMKLASTDGKLFNKTGNIRVTCVSLGTLAFAYACECSLAYPAAKRIHHFVI